MPGGTTGKTRCTTGHEHSDQRLTTASPRRTAFITAIRRYRAGGRGLGGALELATSRYTFQPLAVFRKRMR